MSDSFDEDAIRDQTFGRDLADAALKNFETPISTDPAPQQHPQPSQGQPPQRLSAVPSSALGGATPWPQPSSNEEWFIWVHAILKPLHTLVALHTRDVGQDAWLIEQEDMMRSLIQQSQGSATGDVEDLQKNDEAIAAGIQAIQEENFRLKGHANEMTQTMEQMAHQIGALTERLDSAPPPADPTPAPPPRTVVSQPAADAPAEVAQDVPGKPSEPAQATNVSPATIRIPHAWIDDEKSAQAHVVDPDEPAPAPMPISAEQHLALKRTARAEVLKEWKDAQLAPVPDAPAPPKPKAKAKKKAKRRNPNKNRPPRAKHTDPPE